MLREAESTRKLPPPAMISCPDRTHHNRRGWLLGCALLAGIAASGYAQRASPPAAQSPGKTVDEIRNLRREMAARPRSLVMHADGRPMDSALDELEKGSTPLIFPHLPGTRVSTVTYSLIHQFNVAEGIARQSDLEVRFNEQTLAPGAKALTYAVDPTTVKVGDNRVTLTLKSDAKGNTHLEDLRLWIRYKSAQ